MRSTLLTTTASAALVLLTSVAFAAEPMASKGISPYVTHFIFRTLLSIDVPGVGTVTSLEALGTTENMKGEKMFDKMSARCQALNVQSGDKKYIDGACVLADADATNLFDFWHARSR